MLDGHYTEERRTLLAVTRRARGRRAATHAPALNDVVVNRGGLGSMIECAVEIDGRFVYAMRADGVIVATPTGSTAYCAVGRRADHRARSAGVRAVPIAPHALTHRPIAVPDTSTIAITVSRGRDAAVHCDGQAHFELAEGDRVTARRAPHTRALPASRSTTITSRCCARSCTGARRPSGCTGRAASADEASHAARASLTACCARCRSAISSSSTRSMSSSTPGFTVLTGETGAGKSILLDALGLLLGDRFEQRQLAPRRRARRARRRCSTSTRARGVARWLADAGARRGRRAAAAPRAGRAGPQPRVDQRPARDARAARRARRAAARPARPARAPGARGRRRAARRCSTPSAAFTRLAREVADAWRAWRDAVERRDAAATAAQATAAERDALAERAARARGARRRPDEWAELTAAQRRLANAAALIEATDAGRRRADRRRRRARATACAARAEAAAGERRRSGARRRRRAARAGGDPARRSGAGAARLSAPARPRSRPSSRASSSGSRRSTTWRASTACGPTSCPRSPQTIDAAPRRARGGGGRAARSARAADEARAALRRARRRADGEARRAPRGRSRGA